MSHLARGPLWGIDSKANSVGRRSEGALSSAAPCEAAR
jgi:hypothetical protein